MTEDDPKHYKNKNICRFCEKEIRDEKLEIIVT